VIVIILIIIIIVLKRKLSKEENLSLELSRYISQQQTKIDNLNTKIHRFKHND